MESSGTVPMVGATRDDLAEAAALLDADGPFVSVYLNTEAAVENAAQRLALRWDEHRGRLAEDGAPVDLVDRVGEAVEESRTDGVAVGVIAALDGPALVAVGPAALAADEVSWGALPRFGTLIGWHHATPPGIVVVADRSGADLYVVGRNGDHREAVGSDPSHPHLHRGHPGGWSQRRFQQRAENRWRANAGEVAGRLTELVEEVDPRLVVVAGDVRAVQFLEEQLAPELRPLLRPASGHRAAGGEGDLTDDVARWVRTAAAEETVALKAKLDEELGQEDRAVVGVEGTLAALVSGAVDTLLVNDDPDDDRVAYFGADPMVAALEADQVAGLGQDPRSGRLVDVLIRAAWGGGAAVRMVPRLSSLGTDGVGAVLRFGRENVPSLN